ncbi:hypothetical protein C3920_13850 [Novacetimonas pomaceti]|uniref:Uncharacterized protein n=1 Tax=Novacetimonas pomaceti TaxID=2021998 RepID=A0ABX5NYT2_9PROT|nr:hypothetical protein C3920_13850 [Novacetimonas pomaceti]
MGNLFQAVFGTLPTIHFSYRTEVFGEAFCKKLQKNAAFLKKGGTQKLLLFLINHIECDVRNQRGSAVAAWRASPCAPCRHRAPPE